MKTELERLKVLSALKLSYGKLTAKNTSEAEFKNIEDAIEIVKNCSIPVVVATEGKLCGYFEPDNRTSSATICKHCGREKFMHPHN